VVYKLDDKFESDFNLIKEGLYSRTSKEFQKLFPKFVKVKKRGQIVDEISMQYRVFNKTEDLRNYWQEKFDVDFDDTMEVWYNFRPDKEILTLDKLQDYV
jgi:hypothetical protein